MKRLIAALLIIFILCTGCSANNMSQAYNKEEASFYFLENVKDHKDRFAADLAVIPKISNLEGDFKKEVNSALLINNDSKDVVIAKNPHAKIYPASLTKLMTAYVVLKHANMDDIVTVQRNIVWNESGVKISHLKAGDKVSVRTLYNGLLVTSANDCAVILAEHISGSVSKFVALMNKEAKAIGATNTHFVNPHGLHDDNHYTTAYDLYLMLAALADNEEFKNCIAQKSYTMKYTRNNNTLTETVLTTNAYLDGTYALPADVTMVGGKTGTTSMAGSCLVLLTNNAEGEAYISVVVGAMDKNVLYDAMSDLLKREKK